MSEEFIIVRDGGFFLLQGDQVIEVPLELAPILRRELTEYENEQGGLDA
tara:strand:- start:325 stop:471 length:147 start_codon:yes stop_codon:yes gene_type:complete